MSFVKNTTFSLDSDSFEVIDNELIKTAAFKLPDGINYDPDFLYMWVKAVSAGETWGANKNQDWFPREELKKCYNTFLNAHVFKNHENKHIENAIGDVLAAVWSDEMDCVKLLIRVDNKVAPSIVRGFKSGYMTDVSMGCRVDHSVCSICGNVAKTPREYCEHVKFQRGKIYDDGRKVYEINIGPKFHDISAVLNGAEKTAKVTGIYIVGDKIAYVKDDNIMTKTASFKESFLEEPMEKVASVDLTKGLDLFPDNLMSKKAYAHKVAEFAKDIEGKIVALSEKEFDEGLASEADKARDIFRMCCEEYWDEEKLTEVANKLKSLAEERGTSNERIFKQFLDVLTFTGCELAPREFRILFSKMFDVDYGGEDDAVSEPYSDEDENACAGFCDKMPGLLSIKSMLGPAIMANRRPTPMPLSVKLKSPMRGITIMSSMPNTLDLNRTEDMPSILEVLRDRIGERSMYSPKIIKKTIRIVSNKPMFSMPERTPMQDVLNGLYMAYQNDRVNKFASEDYMHYAEEFANSCMEKTAKTGLIGKYWAHPVRNSAIVGLPLTFGYSAFQKSRIQNGENVGSVSKYIAENPENAYVMQLLLLPEVVNYTKKINRGIGKGSKGFSEGAAKLYDNLADKVIKPKIARENANGFEKTAHCIEYNANIVDDAILSVYNKGNQAEILKMATVLCDMGKDDVAQYLLGNAGLGMEDVDNYIDIAKTALVNNRRDALIKQADNFIRFGIDKTPSDMDLVKVVLTKLSSRDN